MLHLIASLALCRGDSQIHNAGTHWHTPRGMDEKMCLLESRETHPLRSRVGVWTPGSLITW